MKLKFRMTMAALAIAGLAGSPAAATEWLYSYTGNHLTDVTAACCGTPDTPFTTSDFISFHFTSDYLLGANLSDTPFFEPIGSWSLSVGPLSYNDTDGVLYSINFTTNPAAQITAYQFTTQTDVVAPGLIPAEYPPTPYEEEVFSFNLPGIFGVEDGIYIPSIFQDSAYASNSNDSGTWTISAIPEPRAWMLMLIGLGGVGATLRRRPVDRRATGPRLCTPTPR